MGNPPSWVQAVDQRKGQPAPPPPPPRSLSQIHQRKMEERETGATWKGKKMAASSSGEDGRDLWSVSGQRKDENGRSDSTEERRNKSSLASSRQSSEYYAGDSTVKFIWQVCGKFLTSDFARAYFSLWKTLNNYFHAFANTMVFTQWKKQN